MFVQSRWFRWTRNGFAVIGVLFIALFGLLMFLLFWQEANYQAQTSPDISGATPATLQSAQTLIYQAGLVGNLDKRLRGGVNGSWDEGRHVEAYCIDVEGVAPTRDWVAAQAIDPLLAKAAASAFDKAHAALACVPDAVEVRSLGLHLNLIEANFQAGHAEEVRVAAREFSSGRYFLVFVRDPRPL